MRRVKGPSDTTGAFNSQHRTLQLVLLVLHIRGRLHGRIVEMLIVWLIDFVYIKGRVCMYMITTM